MQGVRDTPRPQDKARRRWRPRHVSAGKKSAEAPGARLTGQNGWTEVDGCPQYTNDDFPLAMQMEQDLLIKDPKLDAFVATGGFGEFLVDAYKNSMGQFKDKIASGDIAIAVANAADADRRPEGGSRDRQRRAAAVRHGLQGHVRAEGPQGRQGRPARSDLYRPRHLHAEERRHLHRRREVTELAPFNPFQAGRHGTRRDETRSARSGGPASAAG